MIHSLYTRSGDIFFRSRGNKAATMSSGCNLLSVLGFLGFFYRESAFNVNVKCGCDLKRVANGKSLKKLEGSARTSRPLMYRRGCFVPLPCAAQPYGSTILVCLVAPNVVILTPSNEGNIWQRCKKV